MKKKLALALVFVMGLSFTACGKTTVSDSTNEAVSGGVQSTDTNEDKESSGKSDKTTITFINGFTGGDGEYMTKIVMTEFLHFHWIYMQKQHFIIKNTQMKHRKIIMI